MDSVKSFSIPVISENVFNQTAVPRFNNREIDLQEVGTHQVVLAVTISVAIPSEEETENKVIDDNKRKKSATKSSKKGNEPLKGQKFYHCEYELLPGDEEPVRTDLVVYGSMAKIYTELQEAKSVKTWINNKETWITWTHCHYVTVTESLLKSFISHEIVLRIWEGKDKVASKARFDRPKGIKGGVQTQIDASDNNNVTCACVLKQCENYRSYRPKRDDSNEDRIMSDCLMKLRNMKTDVPCRNISTPIAKKIRKMTTIVEVKHEEENNAENTKNEHLSQKETEESEKHEIQNVEKGSKHKKSSKQQIQLNKEKKALSVPKLTSKEEAARIKEAKKEIELNGNCSIRLPFARLFAGNQTVTERLTTQVEAVLGIFMTISLNESLLSKDQAKKLNPLVIEIKSATDLPSTPVSYDQLRNRCKPAFTKYKIFNEPKRTSKELEQNCNLFFDDINIILAGTLDDSVLREFLSGPRLEIEIHDRDRIRKIFEDKGSLFGHSPDDVNISNVGVITSRRTIWNAFKKHDNPWDPYGIATFDLSDLLLGQRLLDLEVPILNCPIPELLGLKNGQHGVVGVYGAVDGPVEPPMQAGDYVQSDSYLKIRVLLAHPLITPEELAAKNIIKMDKCSFARAVFKFDYSNTHFLHNLHSYVINTNARALQLDNLDEHVRDTALAIYKLSPEEVMDPTLDVITGFKVMDGEIQIYVLEGLREGVMKDLVEENKKGRQSDVNVLFHSNLGFQGRLYGTLGVDLLCVKLHEPFSEIMRQPLIFIRDLVPAECFQGLYKLMMLCQVDKLRTAVKNDIFPSSENVISMSREFGVPLEPSHFKVIIDPEHEEEEEEEREEEEDRVSLHVKCQMPIPIETNDVISVDNEEVNLIETEAKEAEDLSINVAINPFLQKNLEYINKLNERSRLDRSKKLPETIEVEVIHNCGKLKSTVLAIEKLRNEIAKDKDNFYSFNPEYPSMNFDPINLEELSRQRKIEAKQKCMSKSGWTQPNKRSTLQKYTHPRQLAQSQIEDLQVPLDELYEGNDENVYAVPRGPFPWNERNLDMDIWTKCEKVEAMRRKTSEQPLLPETETMAMLDEDRKLAKRKRLEEWKGKIIVDDPRQRFHRCALETELLERGPKSANQMSRLAGLMKDPPQKYIFRKNPIGDLPALAVVNYPSVDTTRRKEGQVTEVIGSCLDDEDKCFQPGSHVELSLKYPNNSIPTIDYNHQLFAKKKGHDFDVYYRERDIVHRRRILPMANGEVDKSRELWLHRRMFGSRPVGRRLEPMNSSHAIIHATISCDKLLAL